MSTVQYGDARIFLTFMVKYGLDTLKNYYKEFIVTLLLPQNTLFIQT